MADSPLDPRRPEAPTTGPGGERFVFADPAAASAFRNAQGPGVLGLGTLLLAGMALVATAETRFAPVTVALLTAAAFYNLTALINERNP